MKLPWYFRKSKMVVEDGQVYFKIKMNWLDKMVFLISLLIEKFLKRIS